MQLKAGSKLGNRAESLLGFNSPKIPKERLQPAGPDFVDRVFAHSDRNNRVLGNLTRMYNSGRLGGPGYLSILPVDQGIEHSGGASFAKNPDYFDPEKIVQPNPQPVVDSVLGHPPGPRPVVDRDLHEAESSPGNDRR